MSKCNEDKKTGSSTEAEFKIKIPGLVDYKVKFPLFGIPFTGIPGYDPAALMDLYRSPDMAKYLEMLKRAGINVEIK